MSSYVYRRPFDSRAPRRSIFPLLPQGGDAYEDAIALARALAVVDVSLSGSLAASLFGRTNQTVSMGGAAGNGPVSAGRVQAGAFEDLVGALAFQSLARSGDIAAALSAAASAQSALSASRTTLFAGNAQAGNLITFAQLLESPSSGQANTLAASTLDRLIDALVTGQIGSSGSVILLHYAQMIEAGASSSFGLLSLADLLDDANESTVSAGAAQTHARSMGQSALAQSNAVGAALLARYLSQSLAGVLHADRAISLDAARDLLHAGITDALGSAYLPRVDGLDEIGQSGAAASITEDREQGIEPSGQSAINPLLSLDAARALSEGGESAAAALWSATRDLGMLDEAHAASAAVLDFDTLIALIAAISGMSFQESLALARSSGLDVNAAAAAYAASSLVRSLGVEQAASVGASINIALSVARSVSSIGASLSAASLTLPKIADSSALAAVAADALITAARALGYNATAIADADGAIAQARSAQIEWSSSQSFIASIALDHLLGSELNIGVGASLTLVVSLAQAAQSAAAAGADWAALRALASAAIAQAVTDAGLPLHAIRTIVFNGVLVIVYITPDSRTLRVAYEARSVAIAVDARGVAVPRQADVIVPFEDRETGAASESRTIEADD